MAYAFRWNRWNIEHIGSHGVLPAEAEFVVSNAVSPYPQYRGDGKWLAAGKTWAGRWLQVVFILDPPTVVFVIHARPLTDREKRRHRRRKR